jgi:Sulfotransferase family
MSTPTSLACSQRFASAASFAPTPADERSPMAVYVATHGLLFIGNKRTASTALGRELEARLGGVYVPAKRMQLADGIEVSKRHSTLAQIAELGLIDRPLESLHKFTTVRNPFDSLVSWWAKLRFRDNRIGGWVQREEASFREWIAKRFAKAPPESMHDEFVAGCDVVLRYESLDDDLTRLLESRGIEPFKLPRTNETTERRRDWREEYDPPTRAIVERVFASDLARYEYSFDPVSP